MDEVQFGRYRLLSVIGEGGMGTVYKAHDTVIGRDVAIKVLAPELGAERGYRERFRREAHAAARLTEPHIIPIHDAGEFDGQLYLVMPVINGVDVQRLLDREGAMSPQRAVYLIEQLAAALDAAHAVGLVHRDIKPSNALVTGRDFAYLIDFGIAHNSGATKLTQTGSVIGTFAYMAPERFSAGTADARTDVYALACVLHECLTGAQPFPGDSVEQQIVGHRTADPPRPSILGRAVAAGFDEVIAAGMAKDPDRRYQTATELADAARHALTGTPTGETDSRPHPIASPFVAPPLGGVPAGPAPWPARRADQVPSALAAVPHREGQQRGDVNLRPAPPGAPGRSPGPYPGYLGGPPGQISGAPQPSGQRLRRGLRGPLIAMIVVILAAGAGTTGYLVRQFFTASPPATTSRPVAAVALSALGGLLLSPYQINTVTGATTMTVAATNTAVGDDRAALADKSCLPIQGPAQAAVYAGSGYIAVRWQTLHEPDDSPAHYVDQGVALFASAHDATAFFTAAAQSWPACSNRQFSFATASQPNQPSQPPVIWSVGPVSNSNGTLKATKTREGGNGWTCQRALTVAGNVAADVVACSYSPSDSAVNIANQIAAKVPTA